MRFQIVTQEQRLACVPRPSKSRERRPFTAIQKTVEERAAQPAGVVEVVDAVGAEIQRPSAGRFPASGTNRPSCVADPNFDAGAEGGQLGEQVFAIGFLPGHARFQ